MANLATTTETREIVRAQVLKARDMIEPVLPKHVSFERCLATMYKHMFENPSLGECTPASLFWSFVQAAEVGLSVGGFFGEGFIIPYGSNKNPGGAKRARFIVGYKGLLKLCYQSPLIRRVDAYMVYSKDTFVPNLGRNIVDYTPYLGSDDPGQPIAAYTQIELANGGIKHHVMPLWALERIRKAAPGIRKPDHPWNTHPFEMYRKTGLRSALKDAPKNSETDRAIEQAIRMDESTDSDSAYDDVPLLPGLDEEPTGRAEATRTRVQKRATAARAETPQEGAEPAARPEPERKPEPQQGAPKAQQEAATSETKTSVVAPTAPKPLAPKPVAHPQGGFMTPSEMDALEAQRKAFSDEQDASETDHSQDSPDTELFG